ncbi:MAG: sulfatase [Planctomycetota bacterium]|nr:MAG: sulfatase [Planctomycetota bacterium]
MHFSAKAGMGLAFSNLLQGSLYGDQKNFKSFIGKAKSIIYIYLPGGVSAQETFDPKPNAPIQYRGPYRAINTKVDGLQFNQFLRKTAQVADRLTVIHSMTHGEAAHERGTHNMYTGYRPSPALVFPSIGSIISHELGARNNLPPYVCIPNQPNVYAGTGYLSSAYSPFSLGDNPSNKNFKVKDLSVDKSIKKDRDALRRGMLENIEGAFPGDSEADVVKAMNSFYEKAYTLIDTPSARKAFDLKAEPAKLRKQYGYNTAGQRLIMARRLVEYGVRFVSVTYGSWDHHQNIRNGIKSQLPNFDVAFARLIRDLEQRKMLDSTLVVVTSEFGRTPKINKDNGRDHWPKVFSTVLSGGGIKKGLIYGKTDATASEVDEDPVSVADFATTIYNQLGIVADKEIMAPGDRPIEIVKGGKILKDLLI